MIGQVVRELLLVAGLCYGHGGSGHHVVPRDGQHARNRGHGHGRNGHEDHIHVRPWYLAQEDREDVNHVAGKIPRRKYQERNS